MPTLERADTGRRVSWLTIVGLILVPLIVAGGFVWAVWNADDRMSRVQAAVVNNDEPVEVDGQTVPMGRQLAAGLVDSSDENYDWVLSDDEDAAEGIANGKYAAVVTIPETFSADATSFGEEDGTDARQAEIEVETSKVGAITDTAIGEAIAQVATNEVNVGLTENYLDNIYLGFNEIGSSFTDAADAASQLEDGSGQLQEGVSQSADGAGELSTGMDELSAAGPQLSSGAGELSSGASQLDEGVGQAADGAGELADGLGQLEDGTETLPDDTRALADGAADLSDGAGDLSTGASELSDGVDEYTTGVDDLVEGLSGTGDGPETLATGAEDVAAGLTAARDGMNAQAEDPQVPAEQLAAICTDAGLTVGSPECQGVQQAFLAGMSAGLEGAADSLDAQDGSLVDGANEVASGARGLADGLEGAQSGADQLADAGSDLRDGASGLADGASELSSGSTQLADGTDQLADATPELTDGISQSADGAGTLSDGLGELQDGSSQLSTGASELSVGLTEYTDGVDQAATGTTQLSDGLTQLDEGAVELADGTGQLADGLGRGADEIPSYSAPERENLKEVVAAPVSSGDDENPALFADASALGLLLILGLWVGALVTYLVVRAVPSSALTSRASSFAIMARGLVPGVAVALVQALVLAVLAQVVLDLHFFDFSALLVLAAFAGIAFAALNFALVAWFGGFGRLVSVALLVAAVAGNIVAAVPEAFDAIKPALPLTPAFNGLTAIITGGPGLGAAYGGLFLWLVVGLVAGVVAVARGRVASATQLTSLAR